MRDMCVKDGKADLLSTMFWFGFVYCTFAALFSQTPAPVLSTVFIPDLKSGIPHAVDIPAPVKEIKCLLLRIRFATSLTFSLSTSLVSKC